MAWLIVPNFNDDDYGDIGLTQSQDVTHDSSRD